jgi:hypothetical protein
MRLAITALIVISCVAEAAAATSRIGTPFAIEADANRVESWSNFEALPAVPAGEVSVAGPQVTEKGRVDLLIWNGAVWVLAKTGAYAKPLTVPVLGTRCGVLVRFAGAQTYWFGEFNQQQREVRLNEYRNLSIRGWTADSIVALFFEDEAMPRSVRAATSTFLPVKRALLCFGSGGSSTCLALAETALDVAAPRLTSRSEVRIFDVPQQPNEQIVVLKAGVVPLRPVRCGRVSARVGRWVAIELDKETNWSDVVVDWSGQTFALERIKGIETPAVPGFSQFSSSTAKGFEVRALIGPEKKELFDRFATLALFPADGVLIPLAAATLNERGLFAFQNVPVGSFRARLFSQRTTPDPVAVSPASGVTEVVFDIGPSVRGRVVRQVAGPPDVPIELALLPDLTAAGRGTIKSGGVRAVADDDGTFQIVVPQPGKYLLRARWGSAFGEAAFEKKEGQDDVDIGEVPLKEMAVLRGVAEFCRGGQVSAIAVPSLKSTPRFDVLTATVGPDAHFILRGLSQGMWSVLFSCGSKVTRTTPSQISVPESGDVVAKFESP